VLSRIECQRRGPCAQLVRNFGRIVAPTRRHFRH